MTAGPAMRSFITEQQAVVFALFARHRSMSAVARLLGLSQIRVREALVQHERNRLRDAGVKPPPLRQMLRGDVTTRFGVPREEFGGRPAKHVQLSVAQPAVQTRDLSTATRMLITSVEPDGPVHEGFWVNLKAYAAARDATLVVARRGSTLSRSALLEDYADYVHDRPIRLSNLVEFAIDEVVPAASARPLSMTGQRNSHQWTVIPHPAIQFETLARLRTDGFKGQITTGSMSVTRQDRATGRRELGAVMVEVSAGGRAHCRHVLADAEGDGAFHDLDARIANGTVRWGQRVEAITFGDIHHAHIDPSVASATWGLLDGRAASGGDCLVDRLRPRAQVFHDVLDFEARNGHDARNSHKRFAQWAAGGGDVAAEFSAASRFLEETRRPWSDSIVVASNHDQGLLRWLGEADFREDPVNVIFFLEASLFLHRHLADGRTAESLFEETMRRASRDGLAGVRFLGTEESLKIGGVEAGIHGHIGADGRQGDLRSFERLGIRATLGHIHRPVARDGIYCTGVCQPDLEYAKGPITAWAVGHVVTYPTGARQHLIYIDGAFYG